MIKALDADHPKITELKVVICFTLNRMSTSRIVYAISTLFIYSFDFQEAEEMVKFQLRHGNDLLAMDSLRACDVSILCFADFMSLSSNQRSR